MADDTEPRHDAGEEPENYDYDENNNSDDNPAQPSSDDTTPVVPSQQEPSNDDNIADEDQAAADAAAADAAAAANSDGNGNQDSYDAEYDDEPLPDVTVNLYINELGDAAVTDSVNDYLTDQYGNRIGFDTTTIVQDLIDGNGTATGKHGWLGSWSWNKSLLVGLIALCVIGILLSLVCLVIGKRSKRNNPGQGSAGGSTTTKKAVVTKGLTPDTKYAPVPTDV